MKYIQAKTILTSSKNPENWFNKRYNMNIYRGCNHGCIYCDSRSDCYQIDNFDEIAVKENTLELLQNELKRKREKGIIGLGSMSDSYNRFEKELQITQKALEIIAEYQYGIHIPTKSDLIVRDIGVLKAIKKFSPVSIAFTITTFSDELSKQIEPSAPVVSRRFKAIKQLAVEGTGILMMPLLPFITDTEDNIVTIIRLAAENGAKFIYPWFGVTMRKGQREYFYRAIEKLYPGLKEKYWAIFGERYECTSLHSRSLGMTFCTECDRLGIHYKMADIIQGAKRVISQKQLSLFE